MATGTTLQDLERMLRLETGRHLTTLAGNDDSEVMRMRLRFAQEKLYDEYDWRGFSVRRDIPVEAGQDTVIPPSTLNIGKAHRLYIRNAYGEFDEIYRGFDTRDFNALDESVGTVLAWDYVSSTDFEPELDNDPDADPSVVFDPVIKLWPVPAQDTVLRVEGRRRLARLTRADDRCELDDQMIVLDAAASMLGRSESLSYKVVRAEARRRFDQMVKENNQYGSRPMSMAKSPNKGARLTRLPAPRG